MLPDRPLSSSFQSGRLADGQPASVCSPWRAFHPAASALPPPHTHPSSCWACQTLRLPPPRASLLHSLLLRSTGLVKVSQSPAALLYRLRCFLFKWRLRSCENLCKEYQGGSSSSSSSNFSLVILGLLQYTCLEMSYDLISILGSCP